MSFNDEYLKLRKKRLEEQNEMQNATAAQALDQARHRVYLDTLYPKAKSDLYTVGDIAPVKSSNKTTDKAPTKTTDERKWFEKGAFEDGYQVGDGLKTLFSTGHDIKTNLMAGILGMGENVVDAGAYVVGGVGSLFNKDFGDKTKEFISKDLYDEEAIAKAIIGVTNPSTLLLKDQLSEENSVLGEKSDSLVQSGGQLIGTAALQGVGVPWFLTTGVTSFGSEAENAFNQGATYGQAGLSAAISAGAEILTEKMFGGISFGADTWDSLITKKLTTGISNKVVRTAAKLGVDMVGEGLEEFTSQIFSNLGSALYREENAWELVSNEEALDGYLEAFIGGAVLGGGGSVHTGITSAVHGRDATSGMTANEEKVFKKIYDSRIEEAQKNGKKLSQSEKNKIYDEVLSELDRGYVSTDTIEEVLGGVEYDTYKQMVAERDALQKEYDELGNMKKGDFTAKQDDRYTEVKQKLDEMNNIKLLEHTKNQLDEAVQKRLTRTTKDGKSELIDTRLAESYNERARRGQAFEADLSKYDAKQQETIKKAIESGVLNNTNRTHEFVDIISKISAGKGVSFDFTNNKRLKESGFAVEGKEVNGFVTKDGITVNIDSHKAWQSTVGHEITHVLEGTEHYKALQNTLFEYAKTKGDYHSRHDSLTELYKGVEGADVDAELTADLVGDYLFTDKDFVNHLAKTNRNVFQKIYDEIKYLWKLATAGSKEQREIEKVKHTFEQAYRESGKVQVDMKYSISDKNSLDKYSQKQYNDFGWARDTEAVTKNELDDMYSKIHEKGSLKKFPQASNGEAIIEVNDSPHTTLGTDNVFVFVTGTNNNPQINKVVRFQAETETEMEIIKEKLYERGSFSNSYYSFLKQYGFAREYSKQSALDYIGYEEKVRRRSSGAESNRADGNSGIQRNRRWTFEETQSNEIAPIKASSKDGVFFAGKNKKYSLSDKNIKDVSTGYASGESYYTMSYTQDGKVVGTLDYGEFDGNPNVKMIEVEPEYRRKGIATKLMQELQKKYPDAEINFGMSTPDGTKLLDAITYDVTDEAVVAERQKLKTLQTELDDLQGKLDALFELIDNGQELTEAQDTELHELGDRWQEVYETIRDLEKSVRGKRATKTFVKTDAKYSLSDSDGKQLTKEQSEYFKDSKVVDDNGRLKVMYHGTPNGDFTVFKDGTYFTENKWYADLYQNPGASSISTGKVASNPKTFEVYLDIKKPFDISEPEARSIYINDYIKGGNAVGINPYMTDAEYRKIDTIDWTEGEDLREFLIDNGYDYDGLVLDEGAVGGYGDEVKQRGKSYVVFSPEQVKNVDNLNPTRNPDIRFSLSKSVEETKDLIAMHNVSEAKLKEALKLGGLPSPSVAITKKDIAHDNYGGITLLLQKDAIDPQADSRNKVYGSDAWTPTISNARTEYEVNSDKARAFEKKLAELGKKTAGGAFSRESLVRSLGVDDVSDQNATQLAERLARHDEVRAAYLAEMGQTIEPEYKAKVYNKFGNKALQTFIDKVGVQHLATLAAESKLGNMDGIRAEEETVRKIIRDTYAEEHAYSWNRRPDLKEKRIDAYMEKHVYAFTIEDFVLDAWEFYQDGGAVTEEIDRLATSDKLRQAVNDSDVRAWLEPQIAEFLGEPGIYNGKDPFTADGRSRSFAETHYTYTAENIVKAMQNAPARGSGTFGAHATSLIATATPSYNSIEEMHADKGRLKLEEQKTYNAILSDIDNALNDVEHDIMRTTKHHADNTFDEEQIIGSIITEAATGTRTVSAVKRAFAKEGYTITTEQAQKVLALYNKAANVPTGYFEAKPERVVGFNEVAAFIIPNNADVKLKQELLNAGYNIAEYDPTVEGDRKRVVNQFENYTFSLSDATEPQKRYGNYSTALNELRLEAPTQEAIAPIKEGVAENATTTPTVSKMEQVEDYAPITEDEANALQSENIDSLTDADAPPEMEAPYYGETEDAAPTDPFDNRDIKDVGNRKVKAYMYENPEVKPFFQKEANIMLGELRDTTKGEKFYTPVEGGVPGTYGSDSYGVWTGTSRHTTADIAYLLDNLKYSYADIEKGLNAIIEDNGAENNAVSKRIEFLLNDRLMNGYQDLSGYPIPADQDYINLLNEKQISEYSEEARKSFFDVADAYAPQEDIAPVKETYETIKPKQTAEPKMVRADTATEDIAPIKTADAVPREVFNKRFGEIYVKVKGLSSGKYHKVGDYGFHLARSSKNERATITIKTPDGKKLQRVIDGGNFWKNSRLWAEAARMVAENDYPNVEQARPEDVKKAQIVTDDKALPKKKRSMIMQARTKLLDKQSVFEDLALKTKNRELDAKANFMRYSEQIAQHFIGNGADGVRSIEGLRKEVKESGLDEQFQEYMYDMHNTDRMSLEANAKPIIDALGKKFSNLRIDQIRAIAAKDINAKTTERTAQTIRDAREYLNALEAKNKPVYGFDYTADMSRANAARLEAQHPQFKEWAQEVYKINEFLREKLVEDGEISRETADLWAKLYPHYVPIRRLDKSGNAINVPLDTNKTGVTAPIKRATGGDSDIGDLFKTLAMRAEQTFKAGARNKFGVELMHTLGTTINRGKVSLDESVDGVEAHEDRLKKGEHGKNPTFTVFENGERVEFEITEDMYDALQPTPDWATRDIPGVHQAAELHKKLLTEYNPLFTLPNTIRDAQDILINSQHPAKTYANIPNAIMEVKNKGKWYQEYMANGGEQNTYFDGQKAVFKQEDKLWKKAIGMPLRAISAANTYVELAPRLAEYMASRKAGASVEMAMLDAARVTTNFAAGGDLTKWANRNGVNFLNASVQGSLQHVRNVREAKANGLKGWVKLATKVAVAGIPALILNNLLWDDDEEYEQLADYVKDNYYIVAKYGDGQFVRIPKGRTMAVIQDGLEQISNALTGDDEVDFGNFFKLVVSNLGPNNPFEDSIFAPIGDALDNKTWYGEDLVPTRLQDLPAAEQYDESTDSISKWLGEKLGNVGIDLSPYKINYLLDQYSGAVGDLVLPMLTPEAENGNNSFIGNMIAPVKDKFTTNSVMNSQNVSDFYDTMDALTANAKSSYATDEDILKYKYMNSVNAELSELYQKKREIQNGNLSEADKYDLVLDIQKQIDAITKESLNTYGNVNISNGYATVGDRQYKLNDKGEWEKISDKQQEKQDEVTSGLGIDPSTYWKNKSEYDFAYEYPEKYAVAKSIGGYENYKTYQSELYDIKADKDESGKSITGSRKEKVIEYVNNLDIDYGARLILFKSEYNADDTYNYEIIDYLNSRDDISYSEMETILKELGFTVKADGTVTWD